jgi:hypothetical protein
MIYINNFIVLEKSSLSSLVVNFIKEELNFLNPDYFVKKKIGKSVHNIEKFFNLIKEQDGKIFLPR